MRPLFRPALTILLLLGFSSGAIAIPRGGQVTHTVKSGESLELLAGDYGVSTRAIRAYNRLEKPFVRPGQILRIARGHLPPPNPDNKRIVVNLPQRLVFLFEPGKAPQAFPIGPGKPGSKTPRGDFVVRNKARNPTWQVPLSIQREMAVKGDEIRTAVPPGPDNPLGKFWIGTSLPGIGLHATLAPASIYDFRSHGCMRMRDRDVEALFDQIRVGDRGVIAYHPVLMAQRGSRVMMEAHPDVYGLVKDPFAAAIQQAKSLGIVERIDWARARAVIHAGLGVATDVTFDLGVNPPADTPEDWWLARTKEKPTMRIVTGSFE